MTRAKYIVTLLRACRLALQFIGDDPKYAALRKDILVAAQRVRDLHPQSEKGC